MDLEGRWRCLTPVVFPGAPEVSWQTNGNDEKLESKYSVCRPGFEPPAPWFQIKPNQIPKSRRLVTYVLKLCRWSTQDLKKEPSSERKLWEWKILHINNAKLVFVLDANGLYRTGAVILKQWTIKNIGIRKSDRIPKPILPDNQLVLSSPLTT
jgi:hypothetical protein